MVKWRKGYEAKVPFNELSDEEFEEYIATLRNIQPREDEDVVLPLPEFPNAGGVFDLMYFIDKEIPCKRCGYCCRIPDVIHFSDSEFIALCDFLGLDEMEAIKKYKVKQYQEPNSLYLSFKLKGRPCPFLNNNACSIYPIRPTVCKIFPFSQKDDMLLLLIKQGCKRKDALKEAYIGLLAFIRILSKKPELMKNMQKFSKTKEAKKYSEESHEYFLKLFGKQK